MRKITPKIAVPLIAAAALALQSCSKDEAQKISSGSQGPGAGSAKVSVTLLPESPKAGSILRAVVSGEDALVRWQRNGEPLEAEGDMLATSGFRKGDVITALAGPDGAQGSAEAVLQNAPPSIRSVTVSPRPFYKGQDLNAMAEAWDADGDNVSFSYEWSVNGERVYEAEGAVLPAARYDRGDEIAVTVSPSDGEGEGEPFRAVAGKAENSPPKFTSAPPADFSGRFIYAPAVSDADGDSVALSLVRSPEGMTISGGTVEWRARDEQKGSFEVTIAAEDGFGGRTLQTFELKVGQ